MSFFSNADPYWDTDTQHFFEPNPGDQENVRDASRKPCDSASGNPVMLSTGNKIETHTDFVSEGEMPLTLERSYNRFWSYNGIFGMNWVSSYDYSLNLPNAQGSVWVQRPDGRRIRFITDASKRWYEDKAVPIAYVEVNADFTEYTHHTEAHGIERYNEFGYPLSVHNRHGIGWTITYGVSSVSGLPFQEIRHTSERQVTLFFDPTDRHLTSVVAPNGQTFAFSFDLNALGPGRHRLREVTAPGPKPTITRYHYEKTTQPDALTGVSYNGVRYSTFDYDSEFRAISTEHGSAIDRFQFDYTGVTVPGGGNGPIDPPNPQCNPLTGICPQLPGPPSAEMVERGALYEAMRVKLRQTRVMTRVTETNPLGRVTEHDIGGAQARITESRGSLTANCPSSLSKRFYDGNGQFDYTLDFKGNRTEYSFDESGRLGEMIEGVASASARTTLYTWNDSLNLPASVTVTGMRKIDYVYTTTGRMDSITVTNLSPIGVPTQTQLIDYAYTYHPNGMVATMTIDGPLPADSDKLTHTYSNSGDLLSVVDGINNTVTYGGYNGFGQPGFQIGMNGERFGYFYDERGRLVRLNTQRGINSPNATLWIYSAANLLESISHEDGVTEAFGYDGVRRLETITRTDADGEFQRKLFYDPLASNVLRETESIKVADVFRSYFERFTEYDEQNRVRERRGTPAQFGSEQYKFVYLYDLNSNLREVEALGGGITSMDYDPLDRLKTQTDADKGITSVQYDALDQAVSIRNPRNQITSYSRDGFGQLWSESSPDSGTTAHQWTASAQRESSTLSDGTVRGYFYDDLSRLQRIRATRDSGFEERLFEYENCENGAGRLCKLSDAHQDISFKYTPYGEFSEQRNQIGSVAYTHVFSRDRFGRLTGITYPDGVRADYVWGAGRPKSMSVTINGVAQTLISDARRRWFPDGGLNLLVNEQIYAGDRYRRTFIDRNGRIASINSEPKQGLGYRFDADSRIARLENIATGDIQTFAYDGINRLTQANGSQTGPAGFKYDANHNRRERSGAGLLETLTNNPNNNQLKSITGPLPRQYSYRASGEVASIFGAADRISESSFETPLRSATFSYDRFNRLKQVTGQNLIANYKVSANDRRVEKSVGGKTTRFVYAQNGQLLYERDLETNRPSQHLYFDGQPIGLVRNGTLYRVQTDHLGRPEALVTNSANPTTVWRSLLFAFNRQVITDQIGGYNIGFPGQYHDEETGFIYNNFRDYDPATGRYLQPDPIGLAGGLNPYGYVGGNPVSSTDAFGLSPADVVTIRAEFNRSVMEMNQSGMRMSPGVFNNFLSTLQQMRDVATGESSRRYLGCGEQAEYVISFLSYLELDDEWTFSIVPQGFVHFRGFAESTNPDDPLLYFDPWNDKFSIIYAGGGR